MMKIIPIVLGVAIASATPALADQCLWASKPVASAALRYLGRGAVIQEYCAPCNDPMGKRVVVEQTSLKQQDADSVTIVVNGNDELDLAYAYVGGAGGQAWTNLAMLVECEVADVPKTLDPSRVGR